MPIFTRKIQDTIKKRKVKTGSNGKEYLILQLTQGESIFVFDNPNTPSESWDFLEEKQEYLFTIKEGKIGTNVLVAWEKAKI
ncbi:MAG: hypothetical protein GBAus27B_000583 [Mycoplasmataceae bacterium]|nr:MAG: hypothetical protein GBAus27B_000583 [Mycoplasmataceae bacterium]